MKPSVTEISAQYVVDSKGKKTSVLLPIKTFEQLLEATEEMYLKALAKSALEEKQEYVSHEEIKRKYKVK